MKKQKNNINKMIIFISSVLSSLGYNEGNRECSLRPNTLILRLVMPKLSRYSRLQINIDFVGSKAVHFNGFLNNEGTKSSHRNCFHRLLSKEEDQVH